MRFSIVSSQGSAYGGIRTYAQRRSHTGLLHLMPDPAFERYAAVLGEPSRPRSIAVFSACDADRPAHSALELYLVDETGERYIDPLGSLTGGASVLHLELIESFDRKRGYARRIIERLGQESGVIASPLESVSTTYERFGFEALPVFDSCETRPLFYRPAARKG